MHACCCCCCCQENWRKIRSIKKSFPLLIFIYKNIRINSSNKKSRASFQFYADCVMNRRRRLLRTLHSPSPRHSDAFDVVDLIQSSFAGKLNSARVHHTKAAAAAALLLW